VQTFFFRYPLVGMAEQVCWSELILHWEEEAYTGSFNILNIAASVSDATCDADGSMTFRPQTLMRQVVVQSGVETHNKSASRRIGSALALLGGGCNPKTPTRR
jgi:hypothetical protein